MRFTLWVSAILIAETINVELIEEQTAYLIILAIIFALWDVIEAYRNRKD